MNLDWDGTGGILHADCVMVESRPDGLRFSYKFDDKLIYLTPFLKIFAYDAPLH
jgi:hypothetical protein